MRTIEERAEEFAQGEYYHDSYERDIIAFGYYHGATEQREIDIEKACEWLKANTYTFRSDEFLKQLVEAMKGE